MSDNLLTLTDFTVLRSGLPLFVPFSLRLQKGESCEVSGPNGIGKTSLLDSLANLHKDFLGTYSCISSSFYLSTKAPFDPQGSVEENLFFWKIFWCVSPEKFKSALDVWNLRYLAKIPYGDLSQGQKQRVSLARLSLKKASLWLLDEPLSNLDQESCDIFQSVLRGYLNAGGMALIATHQGLECTHKIILKACANFDYREAA